MIFVCRPMLRCQSRFTDAAVNNTQVYFPTLKQDQLFVDDVMLTLVLYCRSVLIIFFSLVLCRYFSAMCD